jgi:hypothetical protein
MNLFHYCLNAGAVMTLGSAENENSQNNQFFQALSLARKNNWQMI